VARQDIAADQPGPSVSRKGGHGGRIHLRDNSLGIRHRDGNSDLICPVIGRHGMSPVLILTLGEYKKHAPEIKPGIQATGQIMYMELATRARVMLSSIYDLISISAMNLLFGVTLSIFNASKWLM